jgi:hypothetical protein
MRTRMCAPRSFLERGRFAGLALLLVATLVACSPRLPTGGQSPSSGGQAASPGVVTVDILYLNHPPVRPVLTQVDQVLAPYGDRLQVNRYDLDTADGAAAAKARSVEGHTPLAIFCQRIHAVPARWPAGEVLQLPRRAGDGHGRRRDVDHGPAQDGGEPGDRERNVITYVLSQFRGRPIRALAVVSGVALGAALFVVLTALGGGYREAARAPLDGVASDMVITRPAGQAETSAAAQRTRGVRLPFGKAPISAAEVDEMARVGGDCRSRTYPGGLGLWPHQLPDGPGARPLRDRHWTGPRPGYGAGRRTRAPAG